jgi:hypothetical protein
VERIAVHPFDWLDECKFLDYVSPRNGANLGLQQLQTAVAVMPSAPARELILAAAHRLCS